MKFFDKHKNMKFWLPAFLFVAAIVVLDKLMAYLPNVVSFFGALWSALGTVLIGVIIAFVLYIPAGKFEKLFKKIKTKFFQSHARGLAVAITYIIFVTILGLAFYFLIPAIVSGIKSLINSIPNYYANIKDFITDNQAKDGTLFGIDISGFTKYIEHPSKIIELITKGEVTSLFSTVYSFGSTIVKVLIAMIFSIYCLLAKEKLIRYGGKIFAIFMPKKKVYSVYHYILKIVDIFYTYIYGQCIDAIILAAECSIAFTIIGIDYGYLFGILVGFCNLIPYFGAITSAIAVVIFCLFTKSWIYALITLAVVLLLQQIDANVVQPKVVGAKVGLHPALVLMAITVGGYLYGFIGILFAVPTMAMIKMIFTDIYEAVEARREKKFIDTEEETLTEANSDDESEEVL